MNINQMLDKVMRAKAEDLLLDEDPLARTYGRLLATDIWQTINNWFEVEAGNKDGVGRATAALIQLYGLGLGCVMSRIVPGGEEAVGESLKAMFSRAVDNMVKDRVQWLDKSQVEREATLEKAMNGGAE